MKEIYDSTEYKRSRAAYSIQCTIEYFVNILISDAFLAKLLTYMGISDALIGIISSFITIAFLFQLFSVLLVNRIKNTKRASILFSTTSQLFFMCIYIIPLLSISKTSKTAFAIFFILGAYFANYFITSVLFKWANSFVSPVKRAVFSAKKEMISLASGMVFTLLAGRLIDFFEASNQLDTGFFIIACIILLLSMCNFISLMLIKPDSTEREYTHRSLKNVIKNTFGNKNFVNVIIVTCLWETARYTTIGFLGVYKTNDLLMTVGMVQIINIAGSLGRFLFTRPFGKFSDKHSFASGMKVAFLVAAAAFAINSLAAPGRIWPIVIYTVLYSVSLAGTNANSMNIVYSYVDADYFVHASAIKNSIGGIFGFSATLIASKILAAIQHNGNTIFGFHIYAQQLLSGISFIIVIIAVLFTKFVLEKQDVLKQ